jgi:uncharacterized protein (TIGR01777 family)
MDEIVVSGATGLVGGRLIEALTRAGTGVRALTRKPEAASFDAPARAVGWDGLHVTPDALAGAAAVVHLAGEPIFGGLPSATRRARMRESRVESTRSVAAALAALPEAQRPQTFVCASAVGYYGDRGEQILDEGAAPGEGFLAELCVDWEKAAGEAEPHGVRVVQLRIGVVLAATGGALSLMAVPFKLGVGGRLGSGKQWFPWIHIDDLVSLIQAALADERYQGPANAVAPGIVTNQGLTTALGAVLSRPTPLPVPAFALRTLLGELSTELLGSKRAIPTVAERNGFVFRYPELTAALEDLLG